MPDPPVPDPEPQPSSRSELASFGEELRREREIRGISLKEIADATKISKRFLEAIERNDHRTLPAPVFTRGFVREYARYLGLNTEDIVNRYNYAAAGDQHVEKTAHLERLINPPTPVVPKPLPRKGIPPPYARIDRSFLWIGLIVVALACVVWWTVNYKREKAETARAEATTPPPVVAAKAPAAVTPARPAVADNLLHLDLDVTANSWVSLDADGKSVINDELLAGTKHTFEAKDRFRFRTIGNAAGVTLTLNGTTLPSLGDDGEVLKNRILDRQSIEALRTGANPLRAEQSESRSQPE